jgi:L-amino acid N-acyltransferase YncA
MVALRHPNVERLHEVLASFPEKGFAIVATVPAEDGFDIVATASCMRVSESEAEFAISVLPAWSGVGLGTVMMGALIEAARAAGFARLRGFILATNLSMIRLAAGVGFEVGRDPEDPTIRLASLELGS